MEQRARWDRRSRLTTASLLVVVGGLALFVGWSTSASGAAPIVPEKFDHLLTGFPLRGGHTKLPCEACHVRGTFKGTPMQCAGCHQRGSEIPASEKSADHIPTNLDCDSCHTAETWTVLFLDHGQVSGPCAGCHNGTFATGKPSGHVPTTATCDTCHSTTAWSPVHFDHAGVTASCQSCHAGTIAVGKPAMHILSSDRCQTCHVTGAWETTRVDHAEVIGTCGSCHDGGHAAGMPDAHIPTTAPCDTCHSATAWNPARFEHTGTAGCATCHNGTNATGKRLIISPVARAARPATAPTCGSQPARWITRRSSAPVRPAMTEGTRRGCHQRTSRRAPRATAVTARRPGARRTSSTPA